MQNRGEVLTSRLDLIEQRNSTGPLSRGKFRPTVGEHSVQAPRQPRSEEERAPRLPDPERSRKEAQRRAAVTVRRWCVHNNIRRMWTLTVAGDGVHDRDAMLVMVRRFIRVSRTRFPGLKWLYTLEVHPSGHGFHVHLGVDRFVRKATLAELWGAGFVDVREIKSRHRGDPRRAARNCARYLAKYCSKAEDEGRSFGQHRYERTQGHNPTEIEMEGDFAEIWQWLLDNCLVEFVWDSAESDTWFGPRTVILRE